MSGAQPKAAVIAKGVCIVAEVNPRATYKRHEQGWVDEVYKDLDKLLNRKFKCTFEIFCLEEKN
jgi:urocanate hydratase